MKFAIAALIATAASASPLTGHDTFTNTFLKYLSNHGKSYLTVEEFEARKELFTHTENFIKNNNSHNTSFTLGHNKFSDMSEKEKAAYRGRLEPKQMAEYGADIVILPIDNLPESVDWRDEGVVADIRDQGACGSCWAFSATASMEAAHAIRRGELVEFAEQQLVDCAYTDWGNYGCDGGLVSNAFDYYYHYPAINREKYRPYSATRGECMYGQVTPSGISTLGYSLVQGGSVDQLHAAIAKQPVSVAIEADTMVFQQYESGIFNDAEGCGFTLDHAVTLVGYGSENGQDYYLLRNSWGADWGEKGYMRLASTGNGTGVCGVQWDGNLYPTTS